MIRMLRKCRPALQCQVILLALCTAVAADEVWRVKQSEGALAIEFRGRPFASYSFRDAEISRPYFANIRLPDQIQITRNHPPQPSDAQDHALFHPGVWLAFGDISGHDYWRLKATTEHVRFVESPAIEGNQLAFTVENRYLREDGRGEVCREICRHEWRDEEHGIWWFWQSTFRSEAGDFTFGDQEEMGLGVRVATPIAVKSEPGGRILNSHHQRNESGVWGKQAAWCDYSGIIDNRFVGILLMPHPQNFRPSWYHARDYGFVAVNPFGRRAFTREEASSVTVRAGESWQLRFALYLHWHHSADDFDADAIYQRYLGMLEQNQ